MIWGILNLLVMSTIPLALLLVWRDNRLARRRAEEADRAAYEALLARRSGLTLAEWQRKANYVGRN